MLLRSLLAAVMGLLVGSFLATVPLRLRKGQPIVFGRSACPHCGRVLSPRELVPVISWFAQGRRCRGCGAPIPAYYAGVEIAAALVAAMAVASGDRVDVEVLIVLSGWSVIGLVAWIVSSRK